MTSQWTLCQEQAPVRLRDTDRHSAAWNAGCPQLLHYTFARIAQGSKYGAKLAADVARGNTSYFQTFACRSIRGSADHSEHSHSVAFDVRPFANGLHDDGVLVCDFAMFGEADGIAFLHSVMDPIPGLGAPFQWGGAGYSSDVDTAISYFKRRGHKVRDGRVDAMHFEADNRITPQLVHAVDWKTLHAKLRPPQPSKRHKAKDIQARLHRISKGARNDGIHRKNAIHVARPSG